MKEFTSPPLQSYRRGRTIGSMVTTAAPKKEQNQRDTFFGLRTSRMYTCTGCAQCRNVIKGKEFVHLGTGFTVQLRGQICCICADLPMWVDLHRGDYPDDVGHRADQLKFMVLEGVPPLKYGGNRELRLKQREVWWVNKMNSLAPHGLNSDYDLYLFL
ncbi:hypothetical protein XELAEV_18005581mg [Xenopus laevis]|uniref:Uncharacterized protein n=1 Tax=Xenopus laevis TaxID=8355 RepID=A0A974I394_XENLA|nr:hypothetical protein XELAEV_18005581mg [Xenopus laevis]